MHFKLSVLLLILHGCSESVYASICNPFPSSYLYHGHEVVHTCSHRDQGHTSFKHLDSEMNDALQLEHQADFLVNTTIGMYKFLHPCSNNKEAAAVLFGYGASPADHTASGPLVGRRRRAVDHFATEDALLKEQLTKLVHDTGSNAACVELLIGKYKGDAAKAFRIQNPNFYISTTPSPTTTPTTPTTTTTTPTTTTTTTPTTTTTTPTTITTTPTTITTTPTTTTTTTPTTTTTTPTTTTTTTPTTTTTTPTTTTTTAPTTTTTTPTTTTTTTPTTTTTTPTTTTTTTPTTTTTTPTTITTTPTTITTTPTTTTTTTPTTTTTTPTTTTTTTPTTTTTTPTTTTTTPTTTTTTPTTTTTTTPTTTTTTPTTTTTTTPTTTTTTPTTTTPTTTTTTPTTTTTTTAQPTTTTYTTQTTTTPTTTRPTAATTPTTTTTPTTLASPHVSFGPISCTTCSGLMCLLPPSKVAACPADQTLCLTTVEETDNGRQITRGCASQSSCDVYSGGERRDLCSQMDHKILPTGTTCHFCCVGSNCNNPPHVIPDTSSLYPKQ